MTFKEYLVISKPTIDQRGDFMRLAMADPNLPNIASWPDLRAYVVTTHSSDQVFSGAALTWKAYLAAVAKARRVTGEKRETGRERARRLAGGNGEN